MFLDLANVNAKENFQAVANTAIAIAPEYSL